MFIHGPVIKLGLSYILLLMFACLINAPMVSAQMPPPKIVKPVSIKSDKKYAEGGSKMLETASPEQLAQLSADAQKKRWVSELMKKAAVMKQWSQFNWAYLYGFGLHNYINANDFLRITSNKDFKTVVNNLAKELCKHDPEKFSSIEVAQHYVLSAISSHQLQLVHLQQNSVTGHPNWSALSAFQEILPLLSSEFLLEVITYEPLEVSNTEDVLLSNWALLGSAFELTSIVMQNPFGILLTAVRQEAKTAINVPNVSTLAQQVNVGQLLAVQGISPQAMLQLLVVVSDGYYPADTGNLLQETAFLSAVMKQLKDLWENAEGVLQQQLAQIAIQVFHLNFLAEPLSQCATPNPAPIAAAAVEQDFTWGELKTFIDTNNEKNAYWFNNKIGGCIEALTNIIKAAGAHSSAQWLHSEHFINDGVYEDATNIYWSETDKVSTLVMTVRNRMSLSISQTLLFLKHFYDNPLTTSIALPLIMYILNPKNKR